MSDRAWLISFVRESNRIEGIERRPTKAEIEAHQRILLTQALEVGDFTQFVLAVAPHARLRDRPGLNVRVGSHIAPEGGPEIPHKLRAIIAALPDLTPFEAHCRYETLHPFTDGNGRSGRALWLWHMMASDDEDDAMRARELGFLHCFYYQTLAASPSTSTQWSM